MGDVFIGHTCGTRKCFQSFSLQLVLVVGGKFIKTLLSYQVAKTTITMLHCQVLTLLQVFTHVPNRPLYRSM